MAEKSSVEPSAKKPKRASKWQSEWTKYRLSASKKGSSYAYCNVCLVDFSIAGGGVHEVKRHLDSKKHQDNAKLLEHQPAISSALSKTSTGSLEEKITTAELYFTTFIAEHNLPFLVGDHFTKLCKVMFPDSKIADGFACGRTKSTAIMKHALSPHFNDEVSQMCQSSPFTILCDGGNDQAERKYFAIMVRYWDDKSCQAVSRFLAMPVCNVSTAEALFDAMDRELESRKIPWSNVIGYASDTANVMVGARNSVLSRIKLKQPNVFSLGCLCHLAALCAAAGLKNLPISVDDLLIEIYYNFKYSAKRVQEYSDILTEFSEIEPLRIIKHCTTRWLSLERCLKRLLDQWPALYAYFDREADSISRSTGNSRVQRILNQLHNPMVKLICHFVAFAMKPLNKFSTAFQTNASRIGSLQSDVRALLHSYLSNFVKPEVLSEAVDITTVHFLDRSKQVLNDELGIGTSTRLLLVGELQDEVVGTALEKDFFLHVRSFYETTVSKMLAKFPFSDGTLKELAFLYPPDRSKTTITGLMHLAKRFTSFSVDDTDNLIMEYRDYRACSDEQLPTVGSLDQGSAAIDHFWYEMAQLKSVTDLSCYRFGTLSLLAKCLLVLPHSNADPERLFSMVRKIETDQRKRLDPSTICAVLNAKINNDNPCYNNEYLVSPNFLASVKTATRRSLEQSQTTN